LAGSSSANRVWLLLRLSPLKIRLALAKQVLTPMEFPVDAEYQ
jgi:hypothetical protein